MKTLMEFVDIVKKAGYMNVEILENIVRDVHLLPLGSMFVSNIKNNWLQNRDKIKTYIIHSDSANGIQSDESLSKNFNYDHFRAKFPLVKKDFKKQLPFGLKEEICFNTNTQTRLLSNALLNIQKGRVLCSSFFLDKSMGIEFFNKFQRERKIWWMKLSSNPSRYFFTDFEKGTSNCMTVTIAARFPFGSLAVENIHIAVFNGIGFDVSEKFPPNKITTHAVIRSELCLEIAGFDLALDSIEENGGKRMSIHRKISPYQCSIFPFSENERCPAELMELTAYLTASLCKAGLSVLNMHTGSISNEKILEECLLKVDKIGVPYCLILDDESLKTGLLKLRNRDTTISETIHISDLPNYLWKIISS